MEFVLGVVSGFVVGAMLEVLRLWLATRRRPALSLQVVPELTPDRIGGNPCAYARVAVGNASGRNTATGVSVRIHRAAAEGDAQREKLTFLEETPLAWAGADRGDQNVKPGVNSIAADASKRVDVAHLNSSVPEQLIVDIRPQPKNQMNYLASGRFTLELVVTSDNAPTASFAVDLVHEGPAWNGEYAEATRHLRLENLRSA